jgi:hypothetical protein
MGELQVIVWRGTVARRGATRGRKGATIITELVLRPVLMPSGDCQWRASDGSAFDAGALAAMVLALLQEQVSGAANE